ncbi:MAG TPA: hypothetical protein VKC66_10615 [Xanthobacteraceae bacterium]|nr:hypothetical protein [Xanthobacteraceae bacterium]
MTDDPIDRIIAALDKFEPSDYDADNLARVVEIFTGFRSIRQRARGMPAIFSLLERFPDGEFGSPGPLVEEFEAIPDYLPLLRDSLRRRPTHLTVWMVNRLLNTKLSNDHREAWLSELRAAFEHPLASEPTRKLAEEFLDHQRSISDA